MSPVDTSDSEALREAIAELRSAHLLVAAAATAAGGELRISRTAMTSAPRTMARFDDPRTGDVVIRVASVDVGLGEADAVAGA